MPPIAPPDTVVEMLAGALSYWSALIISIALPIEAQTSPSE